MKGRGGGVAVGGKGAAAVTGGKGAAANARKGGGKWANNSYDYDYTQPVRGQGGKAGHTARGGASSVRTTMARADSDKSWETPTTSAKPVDVVDEDVCYLLIFLLYLNIFIHSYGIDFKNI